MSWISTGPWPKSVVGEWPNPIVSAAEAQSIRHRRPTGDLEFEHENKKVKQQEENKTETDTFIEEIQLTDDGGLIKRIMVAPSEDEAPEDGDTVTVHYVGKLQDGSVFDSSRDRDDPFEFKLGQGQVIKGWDIGVASMKKGEKSILICRADYAYGQRGSPPKIPPNATLNFEVELLSWVGQNNITDDGGIVKKVLKRGSNYKSPSEGDEAIISYEGKLKNGTVFDKKDNYNFIVGKGLVSAFDKTVVKMNVGDKYKITVEPQYAFGEKGNSELGVSSNESVIYELELIDYHEISQITQGLTKKTIKEGENYSKPGELSKVQLTIKASVGDNTLMLAEDSWFTMGQDQLPEAAEIALETMKKGEVAIVTADDSSFGFSQEVNQSKGIQEGKCQMVIHIELKDFEEEKKPYDMDFKEKMESAKVTKEIGNKFFKEKRYRAAAKKYKYSLNVFSAAPGLSEDEEKEAQAFKLTLHLNLSATYLKMNSMEEVEEQVKKALAIDGNNVKALYRKAEALISRKSYEEAKVDLVKAGNIDPSNKDIRTLLATVNQKIKQQNDKDKKIYSAMFSQTDD